MLNKKRTIILIVAISALIVTGLGALSNSVIKGWLANNLLAEYQRQEHQVAERVAQNLENNIAGVQDKLNLLTATPEVRNDDPLACNAKLTEAFDIMSSKVGNLGRVNAEGYFYCSINKKPIGLKAEKLGGYIPQIFNDPEHKPVLSRAILPPGAGGYVAALHVPVYDQQHRFKGTLGGAVYFNELQEKYLKHVSSAANGYVVLLDDNGDVLYHPKTQLIGKNINTQEAKSILGYSEEFGGAMVAAQRGESGNIHYTTHEGMRLAAFTKAQILPNHFWTVLVAVPTTEAAAQLSRVGVDSAFIWFTIVLSLAVAMIAAMMMANLMHSYELQQTKDEFVNLASHQLRTPATAVKNFAELLWDERDTLTDSQKEYLQNIQESNHRQITIVNDMLNVTRMDAGRIKLNPKPTNIGQLVDEIVEEQLPTIQSRKQKIAVNKTQEHIETPLDPTYGRMIIENLISNASKYTPTGGTIEVNVGLGANDVSVAVKDNGVGVAKGDMRKLFGKLNRIPNELSDEVGGTGLGLYLVKKIIELHGGKVTVISEPGKGSEFTVFIPKKR